MQAKRKLTPILVVTLFAALLVAACSGGAGSGESKTWFNLPSVPVNVDASGNADVYGIGLGRLCHRLWSSSCRAWMHRKWRPEQVPTASMCWSMASNCPTSAGTTRARRILRMC